MGHALSKLQGWRPHCPEGLNCFSVPQASLRPWRPSSFIVISGLTVLQAWPPPQVSLSSRPHHPTSPHCPVLVVLVNPKASKSLQAPHRSHCPIGLIVLQALWSHLGWAQAQLTIRAGPAPSLCPGWGWVPRPLHKANSVLHTSALLSYIIPPNSQLPAWVVLS